jgi:hypothetical protein
MPPHYKNYVTTHLRTQWRSWLLHCATSRVRFPTVSLEFFIDNIFPAALWPGVNKASNGNE